MSAATAASRHLIRIAEVVFCDNNKPLGRWGK
jgi:hypothetical protein